MLLAQPTLRPAMNGGDTPPRRLSPARCHRPVFAEKAPSAHVASAHEGAALLQIKLMRTCEDVRIGLPAYAALAPRQVCHVRNVCVCAMCV